MARLLGATYGKGRVRVMRVGKEGDRREVRELAVRAMLTGGFDRAYTDADNSACVSTDTVKNVVNVVARENLSLGPEEFCTAVARRLLDTYPAAETAAVSAEETRWTRLVTDGVPHPHTFTLDANGRPTARVVMGPGGTEIRSGLAGFTFMKATASGWANFHTDRYTTLKPTDDRIAATSMEATWTWNAAPADYGAANGTVLDEMLRVFATTYSHSLQDSLFRMGEAALAAVPAIASITLACPNKHYIPLDLSPFGLENDNQVFVATDEPHGQIECTVGR